MNDDVLTPEAILPTSSTAVIPRQVRCYSQTSSTMDLAREHLKQEPSEALPLLVLAEEQTSGRGRMRRPWSSPPGSALLFSLVLRPDWLPLSESSTLIWLAAVSLCEGIAAVSPLRPCLKWPNDALLPTSAGTYAKIAGILLESGSRGTYFDWAIIGCGLNVNASPPPDILRYPATNLAAELGQPVPRLPLLRAILDRMDTWYQRLEHGERDALFAAWRDLLITPGQQVQVQTADGIIAGVAEDVEPSGALRIRDEQGKVHTVTSGDVDGATRA